MKECSKTIARRLRSPEFINHYFAGAGIDVGGGSDPLGLYCELFCRMQSVRSWDVGDGDAQFLHGVDDESFDFVHSSHCLEHLVDPRVALGNWLRVLKPSGHLVVTVPDEDLYEQGVFPSSFNRDHKWTFTIFKKESWSPRSLNLVELIRDLAPTGEVLRLELLASGYRYGLPRYDQTLSPVAESGIELVIRKRPASEIEAKGRWARPAAQPDRETKIHLNQYRDDLRTLKQANDGKPPFGNDGPL